MNQSSLHWFRQYLVESTIDKALIEFISIKKQKEVYFFKDFVLFIC